MTATKIAYSDSSAFEGWHLAPALLAKVITDFEAQTLLEIGCGPNPTLALSDLPQGFRYVVSDIDASELAKAPPGYEQQVLDATDEPPTQLINAFDLIFSRMVNEHVRDGRRYHANILKMLKPGGIALHCSASLGALPFLANRFIPDAVADRLLDFFNPRDRDKHDRFSAHYSWCRGPTPNMIQAFQKLGYEVLTYNGYFGHDYYRRRSKVLERCEQLKTNFLVKHPNPHLCSYTTVMLRRNA